MITLYKWAHGFILNICQLFQEVNFCSLQFSFDFPYTEVKVKVYFKSS